jgi:hypothetical protein
MARPAKKHDGAGHTSERQKREQEVLRANKELAAYFKGRRTEREARAALKIIKAFIRDRERADPGSLRPLPGVGPTTVTKRTATRRSRAVRTGAGRKPRRQVPDAPLEGHGLETGFPTNEEAPEPDEST